MLPRAAILTCMLLTVLVHGAGQERSNETGVVSSAEGATVHITSSPSGGEIYIDGRYFGNTPSQVRLTAGEHTVKVTIGTNQWSRRVQITSGEITVHAEISQVASEGSGNGTEEKAVTKRQAEDALHALAETIKQCPQELLVEHRWGKGPTEIEQWRMGPPQNVTWDVRPRDSARSPFTGYIEFTMLLEIWVPPESYEKWASKYPVLEEVSLQQRPSEYRYEFDIGPDGLELARTQYRDEKMPPGERTPPPETAWKPTKPAYCWGKAAQKAQTVSSTPPRQ